MTDGLTRCSWCLNGGDIYTDYHDQEWGVPEHDDQALFEKLILDGFQAGLSWLTILKKRPAFRDAFDGFDPARIAAYGPKDVERLMQDAGIVRNRQKIEATIGNARGWLEIMETGAGSFDRYIWQFTDGVTLRNTWRSLSEVPAETAESKAMSKDLKSRGFRFVGPTIVYAFMQAVGVVNDHVVDCFRYNEV